LHCAQRSGRPQKSALAGRRFWAASAHSAAAISIAKIEELVNEMKDQFTILIVTHNIQQAARYPLTCAL
jgi:hypothetical protein